MDPQDHYHRILAALHECALDDRRWPEASGLIDEACGSKGNMLVFGDDSSQRTGVLFARFCYRGERHEDAERQYYRDIYPVDDLLPRLRRLPHGRIVSVDDLSSGGGVWTSPPLKEAAARGEIENALRVRLDGPDRSRIFLTLADPVDAAGWTSARTDMLARLLPHVAQFLRVRHALVEAEARGLSIATLLDSDRLGVVELDRRGRVGAANRTALDILRQGDALFEEGRILHARSPAHDENLGRLVARAIPPYPAPGRGGSMTVPRSPAGLPLVLHVVPAPPPGTDIRPSGLAALALLVDLRRAAPVNPALVATALDLAPTEAEVAVLLTQGRTVADIAASTGRRPSTVRWHLRRIFAKLGVARQYDVARLVTALARFS